MLVRGHLVSLIAAWTFFSCGIDSEEENFSGGSKNNSVNKRSSSDAVSEKEKVTPNEGSLACEGTHLHGNLTSCHNDDPDAIKAPTSHDNIHDPENLQDKSKNHENHSDEKEDEQEDNPITDNETDPSPDTETPDPAKDPAIVEFRIKAGTGSRGWNTQSDMIEARIGQTIRIFNDDSVIHRLHTANNAPCPHGTNIPVGGSRDCVVGRAFDSTISNAVYDHIAGPNAKIWIKTQ